MYRRGFLKWVGATTAILTIGGERLDYDDAEAELRTIADELDELDISDPDESLDASNVLTGGQLNDAIEAFESNGALEDAYLRAAWVSYRVRKWIPGSSDPNGDRPQLVRQKEAIEATIDYYSHLRNYLSGSIDVYTKLAELNWEFIQQENVSSGIDAYYLENLQADFEKFENEMEYLPSDSKEFDELTPETEQILSQARILVEGYQLYADIQELTLDARTDVREGAVARENGDLRDATQRFESVEAIAQDIPDELRGFEIDSLSLGDYDDLLGDYRIAAKWMKESCSGIDKPAPHPAFDEALEKLFETRAALEGVY